MALKEPQRRDSEPIELARTARWFISECIAVNLLCRQSLPEPHRARTAASLTQATRRMTRYLVESEAGTCVTPQADCQARMLRLTMDHAARCYEDALNWVEIHRGPVPDAMIDTGRRIAALASLHLPTFPPALNGSAYQLEILDSA